MKIVEIFLFVFFFLLFITFDMLMVWATYLAFNIFMKSLNYQLPVLDLYQVFYLWIIFAMLRASLTNPWFKEIK